MAPPLKFPSIDPALVTPGKQFLKNSAPFRGKGVYVIVDHIEPVTDSQGTRQRVHYRNSETDRRGSMMLEDFCLGVEHLLPPEEPKVEAPVPGCNPETTAESVATYNRSVTETLPANWAERPVMFCDGSIGDVFRLTGGDGQDLYVARRGGRMLRACRFSVTDAIADMNAELQKPADIHAVSDVPQFSIEAEVRALRSQNAEILALLSRVLRALPQQLPLIGS